MPKPHTKLYALGIVAHPDDETFMFGGSALKWHEQQKKVAAIVATRGEAGADRLNRGLTKPQMAKERQAELLKAAKIVKLAFVKFLNFPDGRLDQADPKKLVPQLVKMIELHQPTIILTFGPEGITGHKDHVAIYKAALAAIKKSNHKPQELWLASRPASKMEAFHEHLAKRKVHHSHFHKKTLRGVSDYKLTFINIKKYRSLKSKAIAAHKSQYVPNLTLQDFLDHEVFEIIKL